MQLGAATEGGELAAARAPQGGLAACHGRSSSERQERRQGVQQRWGEASRAVQPHGARLNSGSPGGRQRCRRGGTKHDGGRASKQGSGSKGPHPGSDLKHCRMFLQAGRIFSEKSHVTSDCTAWMRWRGMRKDVMW